MNKLQRLIGVSAVALTTAIGLSGCKPTIREIKDLTGDGILDAIVTLSILQDDYLFIGQEDGTYIRAVGKSWGKNEYFETETGEVYFPNEDGFYKQARD
jgi:hypothetical protein